MRADAVTRADFDAQKGKGTAEDADACVEADRICTSAVLVSELKLCV